MLKQQQGISMGLVIVLVAMVFAAASVAYVFRSTQTLTRVSDTQTMETMQSAPMMQTTTMLAAPETTLSTITEGQPSQPKSTEAFAGAVLAGSPSPLLDFSQSDYELALRGDRLIVLYFYANWCPICQEETREALYPAFNGLADSNIVGFRVNYNDNKTSDEERALAREHGVAYQHTKVFVRNGERLLKSPEAWDFARYQTEFNKHQ